MTSKFITVPIFKTALKDVHNSLLELVKRLDFLEEERIAQGLQIKRVDDNSRERFDIYMEYVNENYKAIMEHPVFSSYKG